MKRSFIYILLIILTNLIIISCGSSKKVTSYKKTKSSYSKNIYRASDKNRSSKDSNIVLKTAKSFLGTPYKYGGTNRTGFDCSGLVMVSFDRLGFKLPRNSAQQSKEGKQIKISEVREGDLVFFNTSGNSISHVGIIERIERSGEIKFIHSSTSKGVIISSMDENYWKTRFVKAVRLL